MCVCVGMEGGATFRKFGCATYLKKIGFVTSSQSETMSNGTRVLCSIVATAMLQVSPTGRPCSWLQIYMLCYYTACTVAKKVSTLFDIVLF